MLKTDINPKLYYSIKEIAQMFNITESTLRYWETEFPQLKPKALSGSKIRQYSDKDIEHIRLIYNLVKVRGFKLAAARKMLSINRSGVEKNGEILNSLFLIRDELKALKQQLEGLM